MLFDLYPGFLGYGCLFKCDLQNTVLKPAFELSSETSAGNATILRIELDMRSRT